MIRASNQRTLVTPRVTPQSRPRKGVPHVNELLHLFRLLPKDRVRTSHEWVVTAAFTALAVVPAMLWPTGSVGPQGGWNWWPSLLLFGVLSVLMAKDHLARPLHLRALFVVLCMIFHLGVLLPVFTFLGHRFMGLDTISPQLAEACWSAVRAYSGFMVLTLGMRSSTLMTRWAEKAAPTAATEIANS